MEKKILIAGVGNLLFTDEGVGVHIIHQLQKMDFSSSILFVDGATAGFKLLTLFENYKHAKFIIIDALKITNNKPSDHTDRSSIYVIPLKDFYKINSSEYLENGFISFHQTSISDVLDLLYVSHRTRISGFFIGINISKTLDMDNEVGLPLSMGLSENIEALVPRVIDTVKKTLAKL